MNKYIIIVTFIIGIGIGISLYIIFRTTENFHETILKNKGAKKYNTNKAIIYTLDNFLTDEECDKVIEISNTNLIPSKITTYNPDMYFRTSYTCEFNNINKKHRKYIDFIENKICNLIEIDNSLSEVIQSQKYEVGQEFKLHTDFFTPNTYEYTKNCSKQGNRTWTIMIYLKNTEEGGETTFPKIPLTFKPKKGMAIIWNNLNDNGIGNDNTLHCGKPIIKGNKFIITKWFRQLPR
tara:strand:- start:757 stop:1464 length:708 start_codon:yes stop_codon:yes gene_type:complete